MASSSRNGILIMAMAMAMAMAMVMVMAMATGMETRIDFNLNPQDI